MGAASTDPSDGEQLLESAPARTGDVDLASLQAELGRLRAENEELARARADTARANVHAALQLVELSEARREEAERRNAELAAALAAAEAAALEKERFLARLSHELRTPLNGIIGMGTLLERCPLRPHERDLLQAGMQSADELLEMVEDLLDFTSIRSDGVELAETDFELAEVVERVALLMRPRAEAKGLTLELTSARALPTWVRGDPTRLRQCLVHLLSNAIKFTSEGGVQVDVRAVAGAEAGTIGLAVDVRDTGCGIEAGSLEDVFEPFLQGDESSTRDHGGLGLGLAIVRQLATAMGGGVDVASGPGGSTFTLRLVLREPAAERAGAVSEGREDRQDSPRGLRVLVVEDNPVNLRFASEVLRRLGLEVEVAVNGRLAAERARAVRFDLILMDCQMPEMDGYEATAEIRRYGRSNHAPIVALTANAMRGDREKCLRAGMDDYLAKPFRPQQLETLVAHWTGTASG